MRAGRSMITNGMILALGMLAGFGGMSTPAQGEVSANHWAGSVIIGPDDEACDTSRRGAIRYNAATDRHEYCDGVSEWKAFLAISGGGGDPPVPPAGAGYFVLSFELWSGNLGGISGADAKCLEDLENNDWLNKADAVSRGLLVPSKVKAFLCKDNTSTSCNNVLPAVTYSFAVSGFPAYGGASFMVDETGQGPGNTQNWSGTNYFGMAVTYWMNRHTVSPSLWSIAGAAGTGTSSTCGAGGFSSSSGSMGGAIGVSNNTGSGRWNSGTRPCADPAHLICMVHP